MAVVSTKYLYTAQSVFQNNPTITKVNCHYANWVDNSMSNAFSNCKVLCIIRA